LLREFLKLDEIWPCDGSETSNNCKRHDVALELFINAWNFCEKQEMNNEKTATVLALIYELVSWTCLRDAPQPTMQESYAQFEKELLKHAVHNPPKSIAVFTLPEVKSVAQFVVHYYLSHLQMYQYVLGKTRLLQIVPSTTTAPTLELQVLPRDSKLFRLTQEDADVEYPPTAPLPPLSSAIAYVPCDAYGYPEASSASTAASTTKVSSSGRPEFFAFIEEPDTQQSIADALARYPVTPSTGATNASSNAGTAAPNVPEPQATTSARPKSAASSSSQNPSSTQGQPLPSKPQQSASTVPFIPSVGELTQGMVRPVYAGSSAFVLPTGFSALPTFVLENGGDLDTPESLPDVFKKFPKQVFALTHEGYVPVLSHDFGPEDTKVDTSHSSGWNPVASGEDLVKAIEEKVKSVITAQLAAKSGIQQLTTTTTPETPHLRRLGSGQPAN